MDTVRKTNDRLDGLIPYDPKYLPAQQMLSANENPDNFSEELQTLMRHASKKLKFNRYPDPLANELRQAIAEANGLEKENVLIGNGGDELLFNTALAWGGPGRTFLNVPPTFSVYAANARLTGTNVVDVPRREDFSIDCEAVLDRVKQGDIDFVIITSPNNPTGNLADESFLAELLNSTDALVMVDEAYGEFGGTTMRHYLSRHKNLVLLRTFSKAFASAGVRLGYILAHEDVIREYIKVRQPYSVDTVSQMIGRVVFENRNMFSRQIENIIEQRGELQMRMKQIYGIKVYPSSSNFILFKVKNAGEVWQELYERGVLIRDFSSAPGLEDCLRVTVGTAQENEAFLDALTDIIEQRRFADANASRS